MEALFSGIGEFRGENEESTTINTEEESRRTDGLSRLDR
jgi:hypothetical protein